MKLLVQWCHTEAAPFCPHASSFDSALRLPHGLGGLLEGFDKARFCMQEGKGGVGWVKGAGRGEEASLVRVSGG